MTDEVSQVMSRLNVDDDGEVRCFGPSSNLNLVSDVPRVAHPPRQDGRSGSVSSSLSMPGDILDFDHHSATSPLGHLAMGDLFNTQSYFDSSTTINMSPNSPTPGVAQHTLQQKRWRIICWRFIGPGSTLSFSLVFRKPVRA